MQDEPSECRLTVKPAQEHRPVLFASLEHVIPPLAQGDAPIVCKAGGLGKVIGSVVQHHTRPLQVVTLAVRGLHYPGSEERECCSELRPIHCHVGGGRVVSVEIKAYRLEGGALTYYVGSAPFLLRGRNSEMIYPQDMDSIESAEFYSCYNQLVAAIADGHDQRVPRCRLYSIADYHAALAPLLLLDKYGEARMHCNLVLHNAEFTTCWDCSSSVRAAKQLNDIFRLKDSTVLDYVELLGTFNMLNAAVQYISRLQNGVGVVAVSERYAEQCQAKYEVFWGLQKVGFLSNPVETSSPDELLSGVALSTRRSAALRETQKELGFKIDPAAKLVVFLGRMTYQKGVDLIADAAAHMLRSHQDMQLLVVGPPGDRFGRYTASKLQALILQQEFIGRLVCLPRFTKLKKHVWQAATFNLMPSRDEPFGYVDVEFAEHGALCIGSDVGGLGKMPGYYYQPESQLGSNLMSQLCEEVDRAFSASRDETIELGLEAIRSVCEDNAGSVKRWVAEMDDLYSEIEQNELTDMSKVRRSAAVAPKSQSLNRKKRQLAKAGTSIHITDIDTHLGANTLFASDILTRQLRTEQDHLVNSVDPLKIKCCCDWLSRPDTYVSIMRQADAHYGHHPVALPFLVPENKRVLAESITKLMYEKAAWADLYNFNVVVALGYILGFTSVFVAFDAVFEPDQVFASVSYVAAYIATYALASAAWAWSLRHFSVAEVLRLAYSLQGWSLLALWAIGYQSGWSIKLALLTLHAIGGAATFPVSQGMNFLEDMHQEPRSLASRIRMINHLSTLLVLPAIAQNAHSLGATSHHALYAVWSLLLLVSGAHLVQKSWAIVTICTIYVAASMFLRAPIGGLAIIFIIGSHATAYLPLLYRKVNSQGRHSIRRTLDQLWSRKTFRYVLAGDILTALSTSCAGLLLQKAFLSQLSNWSDALALFFCLALINALVAPILGDSISSICCRFPGNVAAIYSCALPSSLLSLVPSLMVSVKGYDVILASCTVMVVFSQIKAIARAHMLQGVFGRSHMVAVRTTKAYLMAPLYCASFLIAASLPDTTSLWITCIVLGLAQTLIADRALLRVFPAEVRI